MRKDAMFWQFALVNGRLAEVFFRNGKVEGHCYVEAKEYKTRKEKRWIAEDTRSLQLTYGKRGYLDKLTGKKLPRKHRVSS